MDKPSAETRGEDVATPGWALAKAAFLPLLSLLALVVGRFSSNTAFLQDARSSFQCWESLHPLQGLLTVFGRLDIGKEIDGIELRELADLRLTHIVSLSVSSVKTAFPRCNPLCILGSTNPCNVVAVTNCNL